MSEVLVDNEILISLVESRPVLWDKTLDIFKDRDATRNAWREVCLELRNDFDELDNKEKNLFGQEVLKRWKNLRDSFAKAEKKLKEGKASGSKGTKRKKYIFSEKLQFLKKIYNEREATESYDIENKEEDAIPEVNTSKETAQAVTSNTTIKSKPLHKTRQHQKTNEVDIKIMKALDNLQEKPNSNMSFFHSLIPHVEKFNDNEMLEFQIGVMQLISGINSKQTAVSNYQDLTIPSLDKLAPYHSQSLHFPYVSPHHFTSQTTPPFNTQHLLPYRAASFTGQIQHPFATQSTSLIQKQATNVVPVSTTLTVQTHVVSPVAAEELRNENNSTSRLYETFLERDESSERPSSVYSTESSMNLDFTDL